MKSILTYHLHELNNFVTVYVFFLQIYLKNKNLAATFHAAISQTKYSFCLFLNSKCGPV